MHKIIRIQHLHNNAKNFTTYALECFTRFRHTLFWNVSKFKNFVKSITLKHVRIFQIILFVKNISLKLFIEKRQYILLDATTY